MSFAAMLLLAMLLDAAWGEPRWLWSRMPHPAVVMGRMIGWCDARLNTGLRRAMGVVTVMMLVSGAGLTGWIIAALPLGWLWSVLLAAILLAQRSLVDHLRAVADALRLSLPGGRRAVAMIVGRDTAEMDSAQVARAAIESGAENLSDGIIAPAFWFLIAGLPGILIYKIVNTADSMIGHRTPRHEAFGWAAARLDDVLNWVPARLTALLIVLSHAAPQAWAVVQLDAHQHPSPNAGWPEAAMAGVLGIALSGPRRYAGVLRNAPFVHTTGRRDPGPDDITAACRVLWRTWALFLALVAIIALF